MAKLECELDELVKLSVLLLELLIPAPECLRALLKPLGGHPRRRNRQAGEVEHARHVLEDLSTFSFCDFCRALEEPVKVIHEDEVAQHGACFLRELAHARPAT